MSGVGLDEPESASYFTRKLSMFMKSSSRSWPGGFFLKRIALLGWMLVVVASGQTVQTVEGEGMGMTRDAALTGAKRDAVEKGIGVVVASETLVKNFAVVEDRIISKANGFIKTYKEISSTQGPDGLWTLRISAVVTDILDELVKDQLAMDLLLSWVRHPRFMVILQETNIEDTNSNVAATEVGRLLSSKGFEIVSPEQTAALRQRNVNLAAMQGDAAAAAGLAAEFGAEYIIMGQAVAKAVPIPIPGVSRLSGQANITAKVVRVDNAQIIAQETFHGKSTHIDASTAGVNALKRAGKDLAEYLMIETVKRWSMEQSNARLITVKVSGVTFQQRREIINHLTFNIEGVKNVDQRGFSGGLVTLAVSFAGSNEDLAGHLDGTDLGNFVIYINGMTANGLELVTQAK